MRALLSSERRRRRLASLLCGLLCLGIGAVPLVGATESSFAPPQRTWFAPGRIFSSQIPDGWGAVALNATTVQFTAFSQAGTGTLVVERIGVPQGASSQQIMIKVFEERLSKLPSFGVISRRALQIAGQPAATLVGTYLFQGNAKYPRAVEEVVAISGTAAFIFHFECFSGAAQYFSGGLSLIYSTFRPQMSSPTGPAPATDALHGPFAPQPPQEKEKMPEKIPF